VVIKGRMALVGQLSSPRTITGLSATRRRYATRLSAPCLRQCYSAALSRCMVCVAS